MKQMKGTILLSNWSFWFRLVGEKVTQQQLAAGCGAPPFRTTELLSGRPSGFVCGACWRSVLRDATWCGATVKREVIWGLVSLRRTFFTCIFLLLLQLSLPQLFALFLHLFLVPLGLFHHNFKVFDLLLDQCSILGRSDPKSLKQISKNCFIFIS